MCGRTEPSVSTARVGKHSRGEERHAGQVNFIPPPSTQLVEARNGPEYRHACVAYVTALSAGVGGG